MSNALTIARKELVDHFRDTRALASMGVYALMGPAVTWLILLVSAREGGAPFAAAVPVMAAVFTLMSAFSGANGVAIDMVAGERERRSLLPLLMNVSSRSQIVAGKWLSVSIFALCSALVTLLAFVLVFAFSPGVPTIAISAAYLTPSLAFLAVFAAALELLVSTCCKSAKEANAYLTILIFVAIGISMWVAFSPGAAREWWFLVPLVGHQHAFQLGLARGEFPFAGSIVLAGVSVALAVAAVAYTGRLFRRDAIVYGD